MGWNNLHTPHKSMKRIITTVIALTTLLVGCVDNGNNGNSTIEKIYPGIEIYNFTTSQNNISTLPISTAVRMAMLYAEAQKQDATVDLSTLDAATIFFNGNSVQEELFGEDVTISATPEGYSVTYNQIASYANGTYLNGVINIVSNGASLLSETSSTNVWSVSASNFNVTIVNQGISEVIEITNGEIATIYRDYSDRYQIEYNNVAIESSDSGFVSDWSGSYQLSAPDVSLAYSDCTGKIYQVTCFASGPSMTTLNMVQSTTFSYRLSSGRYLYGVLIDGLERCEILDNNYSVEAYPSPNVEVDWIYDAGSSSLSNIIRYNGYEW